MHAGIPPPTGSRHPLPVTCSMVIKINGAEHAGRSTRGRYASYWNAILFNTFLPPANEVWGKVMFLHLSVILFTGQWRIQDFPEEGAPTAQGGANIRFCQIFPKTA